MKRALCALKTVITLTKDVVVAVKFFCSHKVFVRHSIVGQPPRSAAGTVGPDIVVTNSFNVRRTDNDILETTYPYDTFVTRTHSFSAQDLTQSFEAY